MNSEKIPCPFDFFDPSAFCRNDDYFMQLAYNEALRAWNQGEVPVGAIIVRHDEILAFAHNQVLALNDPTAHGEILALRDAARQLGDWRFSDCRIYVTKEPCPMCSGALLMARMGRVIFGVSDGKMGCFGGRLNLSAVDSFNHAVEVTSGILEAQCRELLRRFFQLRRARPKNEG